ncbi:hypothetical protein ACVWXU_001668 [Streptomyces sp. TE33382]
MPYTNCRASASDPGMLVSDSTHIPPTGTNCPAAAFSLTRSYRAGWCSRSQSSCCACDIAKMNSGWSSISATTFEVVRVTLRTVSRSGHSHAESIWAWPTAERRCAEAFAGEPSTARSRSRAAAAVALTASRSSASRHLSTARRISQRRDEPRGSCRISWSSTSRSWTSSHTCASKTATSIRSTRYSGSLPAVSRSPRSLTPSSISGLAAASR